MKWTIILFLLLTGCDNRVNYLDSDMPTKWVVSAVEHQTINIAAYYVKPIGNTTLNASGTWMADSVGAYKLGDTIRFVKH